MTPAEEAAAVRRAVIQAAAGRPPVWALDFDGTLVPFADHPAAVRLPDPVRRDLGRLPSRGMPVLVLSGRSRADLATFFGPDFPGDLVGNHGLDWPPDLAPPDVPPAPPAVWRRRLDELLRPWPEAWVEDKGATWAVHWRAVPQHRQDAVRTALAQFAAALDKPDFAARFGNHVLDIFPAAANKGRALKRWLERRVGTDWPRAVLVVAVGDDLTDEDMFAAVEGRGLGIIVGARAPTRASLRLSGPEAVAALLRSFAEAPP
ncbi:MAG: trehalose-phosphatase [Actinomycetia bacterium]|nr:trehalose-phosphatase [Actinomycetes bacterium]